MSEKVSSFVNMVVNSSVIIGALMTEAMTGAVGEVAVGVTEEVATALDNTGSAKQKGAEMRQELSKNVSAMVREMVESELPEAREHFEAIIGKMTPGQRKDLLTDIGDESYVRAFDAIGKHDFGLPRLTERLSVDDVLGYIEIAKKEDPRFAEVMELFKNVKEPRLFAEMKEAAGAAESEKEEAAPVTKADPVPPTIGKLPATYLFPPGAETTISLAGEEGTEAQLGGDDRPRHVLRQLRHHGPPGRVHGQNAVRRDDAVSRRGEDHGDDEEPGSLPHHRPDLGGEVKSFHAMKHGDTIASPLWVGFEGKSLPASMSRWLAGGQVGGVVLFSRNIETPAQVRELCREIRSAAGRGNPLPLIAVDQEGGRVERFKDPPFTRFPPARACSLFCCRNESVAEGLGAAIAAELRAVGIDMNFAPVLDVDSNPRNRVIGDRAFSEDAHTAAALGIAFAKGIALPGDPPGRETFPGPRGHVRRLPRRAAGRPGGKGDAPSPRTAPLPPRRARGDPGAHDRPRDVPRARPRPAGHPVPEDPSRPAAGTVAVPRSGHLRRAGDEGDRGSLRHRGGGRPRRDGRVRRRARVPWGIGAGGDDRPPGPGGYRPSGVPAGDGGGGGSVGAASGVGGVERTLSAGAAGGGGGTASTAFFPPAGGLGKYRANISGR